MPPRKKKGSKANKCKISEKKLNGSITEENFVYKYKCDICLRCSFDQLQTLQQHKQTCQEKLSKTLAVKQESMLDPESPSLVAINSPNKPKLVCQKCRKKFKFKESFSKHMREEHSNLPNSVQCPQCPVRCPNKKILSEHISKTHNKPLFACSNCNKTFARSAHVSRHMRQGCQPDLAESYECEICDTSFTRKDNLMVHLRLHIQSKEHKCKQCPYAVTSFNRFCSHWQRKHCGNRFECDLCGKETSSRASMIKHMEIHGEKKFACGVCNYTTHTIEVMRRHVLRHTDEKPFKCDLCPSSFIQVQQLRVHLQKHLHHPCDVCGRKFKSRAKKYKQRSTKPQLKVLVDFMAQNTRFANGEFGGPLGARGHEEMWHELACLLAEHGPNRDVESWKNTWKDLKKNARRDHARVSRDFDRTGNPQEDIKELKEQRQKILSVIGTEMAIGLGPQETPIDHNIAYQLQQMTPVLANIAALLAELLQKRLTAHKRTHGGDEPMVCPYDECSFSKKTFAYEANFKDHLQSHIVKPHHCEVCKKSFPADAYLKRHMVTHTLEKPRRCMYCVSARAYIRGEMLLRHVRMKHPAIFNEHLMHVRAVMQTINTSDHRVKKSELESVLNLLDAVADRIIEQNVGENVLYGGMQVQDDAASVTADSSPTTTKDVTSNPLLSEEELLESLKKLMTQLIDTQMLQEFGWPEESVDVVLEKVLEQCGQKPADRGRWSLVQRLRENAKHLFLHVIEDKATARMLSTHTIDQVIVHILRVSEDTADDDVTNDSVLED